MGCTTCGHGIMTTVKPPKSDYQKALELAEREAAADQKVFVVINDNGTYYHECLECRLKNGNADGTIIAYVR